MAQRAALPIYWGNESLPCLLTGLIAQLTLPLDSMQWLVHVYTQADSLRGCQNPGLLIFQGPGWQNFGRLMLFLWLCSVACGMVLPGCDSEKLSARCDSSIVRLQKMAEGSRFQFFTRPTESGSTASPIWPLFPLAEALMYFKETPDFGRAPYSVMVFDASLLKSLKGNIGKLPCLRYTLTMAKATLETFYRRLVHCVQLQSTNS